MIDRLITRLLDWLIAISIVCLLLWFFITQPLFSAGSSKVLPEVSETNLRNHLINLGNVSSRQLVSSDKKIIAADYVFNYFSRLGKPSLQSFSSVVGRYNNVRLKLGPDTKERVIIGVSALRLPDTKKRHVNASGLSVMLETARLLSQYADKLPISVELVAYGGVSSEIAGVGSLHHANALNKAEIPVRMMLDIQSVGYYRKVSESQTYPFSFMEVLYPDAGNFIALSSRLVDFQALRSVKEGFSHVPDLLVESFTTPEMISIGEGADHVNYWLNDYPAIQVSDLLPLRVESGTHELTMDYTRMSQVVKALYQVILVQKVHKDNSLDQGFLEKLKHLVSDFFTAT